MAVDLLYKPTFSDSYCALLKFSNKSSNFFKTSSIIADLSLSVLSGNPYLKLIGSELKSCVKFFHFVSFISSCKNFAGGKDLLKSCVSTNYYFIETAGLIVELFDLTNYEQMLGKLGSIKKAILVSVSTLSVRSLWASLLKNELTSEHACSNEKNFDEALKNLNLLNKRVQLAKLAAASSILALASISVVGLVFTSFSSPLLSFSVGSVYLGAGLAKNYYKYNFKKQENIFSENSIKIINASIAK